MKQTRLPEIDKLFSEVQSYRDSTQFGELLKFVKKFPHLAPYNAMLLHIQKPGSEFVASASDWKYRFNREVNPGARPLLILRPFGPVAFVFEYNDTHGDPLPESLVAPFKINGVLTKAYLNRLISNIRWEGINVQFQDYGTGLAGFIQRNRYEQTLQIDSSGTRYRIRIFYSIVVNSKLSEAEKLATIVHELGHLYCGHLFHTEMEKWLPDRFNIDLSLNQKEFEAETVCWLVCERMGIENPSAQYLSNYLNENSEIPPVSIDGILKATGIIESIINGEKAHRKELILEKYRL